MKLNKLKKFLKRARDSIERKNKEVENMEMDIIIERALCIERACNKENLLLLDIKQELMEQEQKNIKELRKICNNYSKN